MLKNKYAYNWKVLICLSVFLVIFTSMPSRSNADNLRFGTWTIDGFLRNNTGIWTENWDYSENNDPLATFRNWFRVNLNGEFTENLKLKAEVLAVYESEYHREKGAGIPANHYNQLDFRELRLSWQPTPFHSIRIGKQIVNWGESISARVGDVINPLDARFELGFTNLEDTRMPIWMVRGIHEFISIRSSLDWIYSPYWQPDRYRVNRRESSFGNVNSDGSFTPIARFAAYPETRYESQLGTQNAVISLPFGHPSYPFPDDLGTLVVPGPLFGAPLETAYIGPFPAAEATTIFGPAFAGTPYPDLGLYLARIPNITYDYPDSSLEDARYGFKTSSTFYGWQTGVYFWRANELDPTIRIEGGLQPPGAVTNYVIQYPRQNVYGLYGNKNFDFGVVRVDAAYRPDREYNSLDYVKYPEGIAEKNNLLVQLGLNKDMMIPSLNQHQVFSFILEYVGEFILDSTDRVVLPTTFIRRYKDEHTIFASGSTNYGFGMYTIGLTAIYNFRNTGLVKPSFAYNPDWMNRSWRFELTYTNLFGKDDYVYPYGLFREKDMIVLTTQYSFP
ncbi:MAG: DUF1302 family protein [Desulfobacterales bacterium]